MFNITVREQKPVKYSLTKIIEDFSSSDIQKSHYANILKNYVYIPEKKLIA